MRAIFFSCCVEKVFSSSLWNSTLLFIPLNKTERLFREVFLCAILLFVIEHTTFLDKVQLENNLRLKVLLENTSILVWGYYKWNLNWKSNKWSKENIVHLSIVWENCMKIDWTTFIGALQCSTISFNWETFCGNICNALIGEDRHLNTSKNGKSFVKKNSFEDIKDPQQ